MKGKSLTLESAELKLVFEPEQGGKWRSLRDRRSGREWFWRNPHLGVSPIRYGDSFIAQHDTGGWDEIFPSVAPCGKVPDHGDLVHLPWQVDEQSDTRLAMSLQGRCFPFRFERTVVLDGASIRCDYRLKNTGEQPFPWLWCAHPLLPLSPDLRLEAAGSFQVAAAMGAAEALEGQGIQLNELPDHSAPWAAKLFSDCNVVDQMTVRHADGSGLKFSWDAQQIPYLGLWINHGAWSGCGSAPYFNLGIEPAMLPVDDLSEAKEPPVLAAEDALEWSLEVDVI